MPIRFVLVAMLCASASACVLEEPSKRYSYSYPGVYRAHEERWEQDRYDGRSGEYHYDHDHDERNYRGRR